MFFEFPNCFRDLILSGATLIPRRLAFLLLLPFTSSLAQALDEATILNSRAPGAYIGFKDSSSIPSGFSASTPIVSTYYFYWYDYAAGKHFTSLTDHPAFPETYSYADSVWHEGQLRDMLSAGINVVLPVSWTNPANLITNVTTASRDDIALPAKTSPRHCSEFIRVFRRSASEKTRERLNQFRFPADCAPSSDRRTLHRH